ncbi:MAG: response regulator [Nitrospirae bacterium]|nr:response regulator [Nitrospirota bacterium]MBF0592703.1 response regulator [Nitrospirota bacterium]
MVSDVDIKDRAVEILVVEDSPTQGERLKYTIEKHAYHAHVVCNGVEAIDYLRHHAPTIIISDVLMPEVDGYQLCKVIKADERLKHIPVILLTSLSEPEDVIKGLDCGADNFLIKPYSEQVLISRINYMLLNIQIRGNSTTDMGIEIMFAGKKQFIKSSRIQILDILLSTYDTAIQRAVELEVKVRELKKANETIKTLKGLIPICAKCKKVRNDKGSWQQIEEYVRQHSDAEFTHGFCPECIEKIKST